MHITESSDLIQQVDHLRQTSVGHLDKNKSKPRCKTQVGTCTPAHLYFNIKETLIRIIMQKHFNRCFVFSCPCRAFHR